MATGSRSDRRGQCLVVVNQGRMAWAIGLVIDVNSIGDREQPRPRVPQDRPRSEITPDPYGNVLEEVIGVVRIAAEAAEHRQHGRAMLIDQGLERSHDPCPCGGHPRVSGTSLPAERPSVLPSKTSGWIKVFDYGEELRKIISHRDHVGVSWDAVNTCRSAS